MFRSKRRPLVYTQADHARFAASIALHWRVHPPLPFDSFVRGVADHDRGYGEHDDAEIGVVDNARWVEIQRAGFRPRGEDAVVDLVVALHIRRLLSPPGSSSWPSPFRACVYLAPFALITVAFPLSSMRRISATS